MATGTLPAEYDALKGLTYFDVSENHLTGQLPASYFGIGAFTNDTILLVCLPGRALLCLAALDVAYAGAPQEGPVYACTWVGTWHVERWSQVP